MLHSFYVFHLQPQKEKKSENAWFFEASRLRNRQARAFAAESERKKEVDGINPVITGNYVITVITKFMLPRSSRLPPSEFLAHSYRTFRTPYFSLKAKPNGGRKNRIGVIISVAAVKRAARRNFWKRQIKSLMANGEWRMANGFDFLIIFFKKGDSLTRAEFKKELMKAAEAVICG